MKNPTIIRSPQSIGRLENYSRTKRFDWAWSIWTKKTDLQRKGIMSNLVQLFKQWNGGADDNYKGNCNAHLSLFWQRNLPPKHTPFKASCLLPQFHHIYIYIYLSLGLSLGLSLSYFLKLPVLDWLDCTYNISHRQRMIWDGMRKDMLFGEGIYTCHVKGKLQKMVDINTQNSSSASEDWGRRVKKGRWLLSHKQPSNAKMTMKKADPHGTLCKSYLVYHLFCLYFFPKSKKAAPMWLGKALIFKRKRPSLLSILLLP